MKIPISPATALRRAALENMEDVFNDTLDICGSPIEQLFLLAAWQPGYYHPPTGVPASLPEGRLVGAGPDGRLWAQRPIGKYTADFVLEGRAGPPLIVVECDGHDFHEKTKKQAAHDKKRDRELTLAGYTVVRFTGSELFANPVDCLHQALNILAARETEKSSA